MVETRFTVHLPEIGVGETKVIALWTAAKGLLHDSLDIRDESGTYCTYSLAATRWRSFVAPCSRLLAASVWSRNISRILKLS